MAKDKASEKQQAYAENRAKGLSRVQSSIMAGFDGDPNNAQRTEETPVVAQELARLRAETAENCGITKESVAAGLKDAADMARTMADPGGMVMAWRELGKLLGFYAPEVKKIEKGINKKDLRAALEDLSDEELLQLSHGRVIEGKFKRVDDSKPTNLLEVQAVKP
jgi:hypothetical protein